MMYGRNAGSEETARRIPPGTVGVEIGVWKGETSERFLERAAHLHMVDPWAVAPYMQTDEFGGEAAYFERYADLVGSTDPVAFQRFYDELYDDVVRKFAGRPVTIHRKTSREFFLSLRGEVDWVYIDGAHDYESVSADLMLAWTVSKQFICGDDYGTKTGVTHAVDDFAWRLGVMVEVFAHNQFWINHGASV